MTSSATPEVVTPTGCCAPFDPTPWEGRVLEWHDKPFVREHVRSFMHVPLNLGRRVTRAMKRIEAAGAETPQAIMLTDERSPWASDLYIDVTRPVPGAEMATLSGTFVTKVYDGPFSEVPVWCQDMRRRVQAQGRVLRKLYYAYTTCPRCAKAYGHNYVVLLAEVEPVVH